MPLLLPRARHRIVDCCHLVIVSAAWPTHRGTVSGRAMVDVRLGNSGLLRFPIRPWAEASLVLFAPRDRASVRRGRPTPTATAPKSKLPGGFFLCSFNHGAEALG